MTRAQRRSARFGSSPAILLPPLGTGADRHLDPAAPKKLIPRVNQLLNRAQLRREERNLLQQALRLLTQPHSTVLDIALPPRLERWDGAVESLWEELATRPFRPEEEPPFLALLARPAPESHVLGLALHALCADEAALDVLVRDLHRAYAGIVDEPPVQYADVAAALEEMLEGEGSAAGRAWWREILPAPPATVLGRSVITRFRG